VRLALISLEPWDVVWRRNQHLSAELVRQGLVHEMLFIEPPARGMGRTRTRPVMNGIMAVAPTVALPKTVGGLRELGHRLRRSVLRGVDLLWINDPTLGVHALSANTPAVYDVTDDWRTAGSPPRIRRRISRAERILSARAATIVCSVVLQTRWRERYGISAPVVNNGVDLELWRAARPRALGGARPRVGYIGTLHEDRLDVGLVDALGTAPGIGSVHLVGPDCLGRDARARLMGTRNVTIHGAVPASEVPSWMMAMDVLISPHRINQFTLSLDAIKSYEYAISGKPVVATPTSGFKQGMGQTTIAEAPHFVAAVLQVVTRHVGATDIDANMSWSWAARAREFWSHLPAVEPTRLLDRRVRW
jgi:teichuronic acid biosynthesis glycosyltransferase TuaH